MLELSAVFLAAAVGLRLGWTIIDPGPLPRGQALAERGPASHHGRAWPHPGAAGVGIDRSVCHALGPALMGADPDRRMCRGRFPRLRARSWPACRRGWAVRRISRMPPTWRQWLAEAQTAGPAYVTAGRPGHSRPAAFRLRYASASAAGSASGGASTTCTPRRCSRADAAERSDLARSAAAAA